MLGLSQPAGGHWLDRYARGYHHWRRVSVGSRGDAFVRPLGLVEAAFNHDGSAFEGRADVNITRSYVVRSRLPVKQIRAHILNAWAALRVSHALLRARVEHANHSIDLVKAGFHDNCFVVDVPQGGEMLLNEALDTIVFVDDYYERVEPELFLRHTMNTKRSVDASKELARLFVLPRESRDNNTWVLRILMVCAHQILDGATIFTWNSHFLKLLNSSEAQLRAIYDTQDDRRLWLGLPPAQEDLYPPIKGSLARQRWFWAISRVLRHCRLAHPPAFPNPLRRDEPWLQARPEPPIFDKVLDYRTVPPLNSYIQRFELSLTATSTLNRLCREVKASIGAGGFALVAVAMMELYEERFPDILLPDRKGFIATFPVNPRAMLNYHVVPDSLMLAFSDGIYFPFLPSYLPVEGRFKLLVKAADRQLRAFQKRPKEIETKALLGSRSAAQVLPSLYTTFVERSQSWHEAGEPVYEPQGAYPAKMSMSGATCGVSSVGAVRNVLQDAQYRADENAEFQVVDLIAGGANVRVRDNEFLCGVMSESNRLKIGVAFDGNAIDEDRAEKWVEKMKFILEPSSSPKL